MGYFKVNENITMNTPFPMSELEKLEYIHCAIQELINNGAEENSTVPLDLVLEFVEDVREPHLTET